MGMYAQIDINGVYMEQMCLGGNTTGDSTRVAGHMSWLSCLCDWSGRGSVAPTRGRFLTLAGAW